MNENSIEKTNKLEHRNEKYNNHLNNIIKPNKCLLYSHKLGVGRPNNLVNTILKTLERLKLCIPYKGRVIKCEEYVKALINNWKDISNEQ